MKKDCEYQIRRIKEECKKGCEVEKIESACKSDGEIFKTFRDKLVVKSVKTGEEVGGVNKSVWYFQNNNLIYDLLEDIPPPSVTGKNANYLKVLPCEKGQPHKLELCDKDGKVFTKADNGANIIISKCNLLGSQDIELNDYVRKDWLPSFVIKQSTSKELGEAIGDKSRAEVYIYDPIRDKVGDKVAKLNVVALENKKITTYLPDIKHFHVDSKAITVKKENDFYEVKMDVPLTADKKMIKLILNDLLCLCDESVLSDGYGVEISGW